MHAHYHRTLNNNFPTFFVIIELDQEDEMNPKMIPQNRGGQTEEPPEDIEWDNALAQEDEMLDEPDEENAVLDEVERKAKADKKAAKKKRMADHIALKHTTFNTNELSQSMER